MKKTTFLIKIICISLLTNLLVLPVSAQAPASLQNDTEAVDVGTSGCFSVDATVSILGADQLVKNAKSVFLFERNTQMLMYAWEPDLRLPPSSFVKILNAIIAIENGDLSDAVTVYQSVLDTVPSDAVSADLVADEVLSLEDLIYCMMVGSANDAAAVIANHIAGSQQLFVDKMNAFAQQLGCTGSNFVNVHGLHDDDQYITARDTARILSYAMENESFRTIFSAVYYTVPATNKSASRDLASGNFMMNQDDMQIYYDSRVIGGRTGVASDGTRCLATVAQANGMELICVVLGADSVYEEDGYSVRSFGGYNETKTLLDAGFTGYMTSQVLYDGQALLQREIANGDALLIAGPKTTIRAVLPDNMTTSDLTFKYSSSDQLHAPIAVGDKVCTVEIWYKNLFLGQTDLFAMNAVRAGSTFASPESAGEEMSTGLVIALVVLAAALISVTIFLVRKGYIQLRARSRKRRVMRTRKDRRRSR